MDSKKVKSDLDSERKTKQIMALQVKLAAAYAHISTQNHIWSSTFEEYPVSYLKILFYI